MGAPMEEIKESPEDPEKIQRLKKVRRRRRSPGRDVVYELTDVIKCSKCKSTLTVHYDREGWKFLRCTSKYRNARGGCKEPIIGYTGALNLVYAYTRAFIGGKGNRLSPAAVVSRLGKLHKEIGVVEERRQKFIDLHGEGIMSRKDLAQRLKPYDDKLTDINRELSRLEWEIAKGMKRKDFVHHAKCFEAAVKTSNPALINYFLKAFWPFGIQSQELKKFKANIE